MSPIQAIASCWALLLGIALIMLGNGLQGTLLGLRATAEGFPTMTTGFVMSGYFMGLLCGSIVVPRWLARVGHVRVFAALASLASGAVLLHGLFVSPATWFAFRLLTGFCYAGLYVVAESWLNDRATNETRGQLLSVYMVIVLGGMGAGQLLLNLGDPSRYELFVLVSLLVSFAVVPITLSANRTPRFDAPAVVSIATIYRASPLGVIGAILVGVAHGGMFSMGPVYAKQVAMSNEQVSIYMAAILAGGVLAQWPVGRLSDRFDRRWVLCAVALAAAVFALAAAVLPGAPFVHETLLMAAIGGLSLPLYSLCLAHTNDHLTREQMVAGSATLILLSGIGLTSGPFLVGLGMTTVGPAGYYWLLAVAHGSIGVFAVYRMTRRAPVPLERQREYPPVASRTSTIAGTVGLRTVRDHRDRDLAKWSRM